MNTNKIFHFGFLHCSEDSHSYSPKPEALMLETTESIKTIILPVVLCGCETWSLTLREESRLRVFENGILRRIFGPKRDENGEWRRLHNEEFRSLYRSPNIVRVIKSRRLRWAGHVAGSDEGRNAFNI